VWRSSCLRFKHYARHSAIRSPKSDPNRCHRRSGHRWHRLIASFAWRLQPASEVSWFTWPRTRRPPNNDKPSFGARTQTSKAGEAALLGYPSPVIARHPTDRCQSQSGAASCALMSTRPKSLPGPGSACVAGPLRPK
jgi:hypothetical protein